MNNVPQIIENLRKNSVKPKKTLKNELQKPKNILKTQSNKNLKSFLDESNKDPNANLLSSNRLKKNLEKQGSFKISMPRVTSVPNMVFFRRT